MDDVENDEEVDELWSLHAHLEFMINVCSQPVNDC